MSFFAWRRKAREYLFICLRVSRVKCFPGLSGVTLVKCRLAWFVWVEGQLGYCLPVGDLPGLTLEKRKNRLDFWSLAVC